MHVRALTTVPFLDVPASFDGIRNDVLNDIAECLDAAAFTNGPAVAEFEAEFADYCAVEHCVGLSSGLDALRLALQALGVVPGDEVLVPAMTFVATWEAVSQVGATPVPVDISPSDYAIDLDAASGAVGPRTRAVLPVHLYGQMCDPQALSAFGARHDVLVVEDACQAHGARRDGVGAGTIGDAAAFSFYPSKNLGAIGDAGALVTRDAELATRVRALREHGQQRKYSHGEIGWTGRLDTIQALVLLSKLPLLESWNALRREAAGWYSRTLAGVGDLTLPQVVDGSEPMWHVYVVQTQDAFALGEFLRERGVATGRHYPEPPHLSAAYAHLGHGVGAFPEAEGVATRCLSLPMFPGITEEQLAATAGAVAEFFESMR